MKSPMFWGSVCTVLGLAAVSTQAADTTFMGYPEPELKYTHYTNRTSWDAGLQSHWTAWKGRFLKTTGIVKGTDPSNSSKTTTEAQSYCMLMALWMGDRTTFNLAWKGLEDTLWNSSKGWYKWTTSDANYAGDADQDVAGALIFASALVDKGYWQDYSVNGNNYKAKAKIILQSLASNFIDKSNGYRINSWPSAGDNIRNPSYHMPMWYPVFHQFDSANSVTGSYRQWDTVNTASFALFNAQPNAKQGMARNFSKADGSKAGGGTSSPNNYYMGFDAIRVPYRIGMAALWHHDALAMAWCKSVWANGLVKGDTAGMYDVDADTLYGWGVKADGSDAKYEKPMTEAMWAVAALGTADSDAASAAALAKGISYMAASGVSSLNYFSTYTVPSADTGKASSDPAYNYYAQSLGMLGTLALDGRAPNVWDDLMNTWTVPDTLTHLKNFSATSTAADSGTAITFTASFSKAAVGTVVLVGQTSGAKKTIKNSAGGTVDTFSWVAGARNAGGSLFESGEPVVATLTWPAMPDTVSNNTITLYYTSTGIASRLADRPYMIRLANGTISVHQPWFGSAGSVFISLRNAAGVALYQGERTLNGGAVTLPSMSLAPGWYAVESAVNGQRAVQSFTLTR